MFIDNKVGSSTAIQEELRHGTSLQHNSLTTKNHAVRAEDIYSSMVECLLALLTCSKNPKPCF